MKTKTTILLTFFMLFSMVSFGQTKEETIAWIKQKFELYYLNSNNGIIVTVTPCTFTMKYKVDFGHSYGTRTITFPVTNITFETSDNGISIKFIPNTVQQIDELTQKINSEWSRSKNLKIGDKFVDKLYVDSIFLRNKENDLGNRMEKALKHLATFCNKPKETF